MKRNQFILVVVAIFFLISGCATFECKSDLKDGVERVVTAEMLVWMGRNSCDFSSIDEAGEQQLRWLDSQVKILGVEYRGCVGGELGRDLWHNEWEDYYSRRVEFRTMFLKAAEGFRRKYCK